MESSFYRSIYADGEAEGKAKGKAEGVIRLLVLRMGRLPADAQQVILNQAKSDPESLTVWFDEAAMAADAEAAQRLLRKIMAT